MKIVQFNELDKTEAQKLLFSCCGSTAWSCELVELMPFNSVEEIKNNSDRIWFTCDENEWKESFTYHPKIGDVNSLKEKFAKDKFALGEQSGVSSADDEVIEELAKRNVEYETKFGYIFIVCATGKTAVEMLTLLIARLHNAAADEILIAMNEQNKITHLRIDKLFA